MARLSETILNALVGLSVISSVLTAGVVVSSRIWPSSSAAAEPAPRTVSNWRDFVDSSRMIGLRTAPLQLVEFGDYQCPACRQLHTMLTALEERYPGTISVTYRHFPLPIHHRAYNIARAAECAASQGRFQPYHRALYDNFDHLDSLSFDRLAKVVGMPDTVAFAACASDTARVARIDSDLALARDSLKLSGTPTVLVNGKAYNFAPQIGDLREMIDEARRSVGLPLIPHTDAER